MANGDVLVVEMAAGALSVVAPDGSRIEHIPLPDPVTTNLCFGGPGGRTAYATLSGSGRLVGFEWPRPGLPLAFSA